MVKLINGKTEFQIRHSSFVPDRELYPWIDDKDWARFTLHICDGMSVEDVSARVGVGVGAVVTSLRSASSQVEGREFNIKREQRRMGREMVTNCPNCGHEITLVVAVQEGNP